MERLEHTNGLVRDRPGEATGQVQTQALEPVAWV